MKCNFEEFIENVNMGREIEFIYINTMYFITHNKRKWRLIKVDDKSSQWFDSPNELIKKAKINSKHLWEIWDFVDIDTIY